MSSIVDNHFYHMTTKFTVGTKESREQLPTLYHYIGYLNFINDLIKHVLLQIPVHAQPATELHKLLTYCLTAVKTTLLNTVKQFTKGMV